MRDQVMLVLDLAAMRSRQFGLHRFEPETMHPHQLELLKKYMGRRWKPKKGTESRNGNGRHHSTEKRRDT